MCEHREIEKETVLRSQSHDRDGNVVEVCITLDHRIARRMADRAAKNANGQAKDGALTATVTPQYRKQAKQEYRKWRDVTTRRQNAILWLLRHVAYEHSDTISPSDLS